MVAAAFILVPIQDINFAIRMYSLGCKFNQFRNINQNNYLIQNSISICTFTECTQSAAIATSRILEYELAFEQK